MNKITVYLLACLCTEQITLTSHKATFQASHPAPQEIQKTSLRLEQNRKDLQILSHNALENYKESHTEFLTANLEHNGPLAEYESQQLFDIFNQICNEKVKFEKSKLTLEKLEEWTEPDHRANIKESMLAARLIFTYLQYKELHKLLLKTIEDIANISDYHYNQQLLARLDQNEQQEIIWHQELKRNPMPTAFLDSGPLGFQQRLPHIQEYLAQLPDPLAHHPEDPDQ